MKKKFLLILLLLTLIISCGKKADPEYKESNTETEILNIIIRV